MWEGEENHAAKKIHGHTFPHVLEIRKNTPHLPPLLQVSPRQKSFSTPDRACRSELDRKIERRDRAKRMPLACCYSLDLMLEGKPHSRWTPQFLLKKINKYKTPGHTQPKREHRHCQQLSPLPVRGTETDVAFERRSSTAQTQHWSGDRPSQNLRHHPKTAAANRPLAGTPTVGRRRPWREAFSPELSPDAAHVESCGVQVEAGPSISLTLDFTSRLR